MRHPDSPAGFSFSPGGEIADSPTDVMQMAVTDQDDERLGFLIQWRSDEWFYTDMEAFEYLNILQERDL